MDRVIPEHRQHFYEDAFFEINLLGKGTCGSFYRCARYSDGLYFAVKKIIYKPKDEKKTFREAQILSDLKHENIIKYFDSWFQIEPFVYGETYKYSTGISSKRTQRVLYILTEICPLSLKDRLPNSTSHEKWTWLHQVLLGVQHMHTRKILCNDFHTENILIGYDGIIKLGYFDKASTFETPNEGNYNSFIAPEIRDGSGVGTPGCDVFALGFLIVEMAFPFSVLSLEQRLLIPAVYGVPKLVTDMINPEPALRPTMGKLRRLAKDYLKI